MFPLNDFNFVACALATFSAAVGYNVSRRRGRNPSGGHAQTDRAKKESRLGFLKFHRRNSAASARSPSVTSSISESDAGTEPPASQCGTPVPTGAELELRQERAQEQQPLESLPGEVAEPEDGALKRKRSPSPALANADTPPAKRRRTPPAGKDEEGCQNEEDAVKVEETTSRIPSAGDIPAGARYTAAVVIGADAEVPGSGEVPTVAGPALAVDGFTPAPASAPLCVELTSPTTPPAPPQNISAARSPVYPSTLGASWHTNAVPIVAARPSSAFSAFTGQGSAFATSFAGSQKASIWSTSTSTSGSVSAFGETPPANPLAATTPCIAATQKVLTGEEDEEVETEVKGAKVFIKRGDRDFCEGILGNVKLLKHKETGDQRILFRREPVWKVTMSVRLRSTVRCSFDEAQSALRVTLREPIEDTQQEQLVIYALRRGKASRSEFAKFAKAVAGNARLQDQASA